MAFSINLLTWLKQRFSEKDHAHGSITKDGKVGTAQDVPLKTGSGGVVGAGSFGTGAKTFCEGNDPRLSDARTPTSHSHGVMDLNNNMPKSNNGSGTAGYIKVLNIKTNQVYLDDPITFEIYQRAIDKPIYCSLLFSGGNNTDPTVSKFESWGSDNEVYIYKASTNNWQVIVKKIDFYDVITVENIGCNWGRWSAWATNISNVFTHLDETITTLPSSTSSNPLIKATYNISDVLTDTDTDRSLSANQGKVLKGLIDGKVGTGDARLTDERNPKMNYINATSSNILDLDNYKTSGFYYNNNNANAYYIKNCPWSIVGNAPYTKNKAFFLLVETWGQSNDNWVSITYVRVCNNGTWQPWKEVTLNGMEEIISSTQSSGSSAWTGTSSRIVTLTSGTRINYWLKTTSGTDDVTLDLTLANGDTTGAKSVLPNSVAKTLPAWQMVELVWDGYNWSIVNPTVVVDNLTTGGVGSALSAEQGKWLYNNKASSTHNHDTNYVKLSGGQTMTGNILMPSNADSSGNDATGHIPFAHTIQDTTKTVREILPTKKSFIGAVIGKKLDGSSGSQYDYVVSARHRNGGGDGYKYGMYLRSGWSTNGNLLWSESNGGDYGTEKTILDSSNYSNYANKITKTSQLTNDGDGTNVFVKNNDSRLSDARTPTSHTHGSLANGGTLNSDISSVNKIAVTDSSNNLKTISKVPWANVNVSYGSSAGTACQGNDSRIVNLFSKSSIIGIGTSSSAPSDPFNLSIKKGSQLYFFAKNVNGGKLGGAVGVVFRVENGAVNTVVLDATTGVGSKTINFNAGTYYGYATVTGDGNYQLGMGMFKLTVTN